jgi:hypothetical protein
VSRGGAPSQRLKSVAGLIVCPLASEFANRDYAVPVPGSVEVPRAVCSRPVNLSPSMQTMRSRGYVPVCTHDLGRFKHVLTHRVHAPGEAVEISALKTSFAARHGGSAADVVQTLPPELAWLEERGLW